MVLKLEDFAAPAPPVVEVEPEDVHLAVYEQGYSAGWEDAARAQSQDQALMRADLARSLQALGFTYHEARAHMLAAFGPLVQGIVSQLLPELARETLAPIILEALMPLAEESADAPVTLMVNPADREAVASLLEQATGFPTVILEEPALALGQAMIRLGDQELRVDLTGAVTQISKALRGFFGLQEQE